MELPKDFYTVQSMLTLSGSAGATFVVCNGLQRALDFNPRWLALAVAQVVVLGGVYFSQNTAAVDYFIGVINGFLVFCTAAGATNALGSPAGQGAVARSGPSRTGHKVNSAHTPKRRFLTSWF